MFKSRKFQDAVGFYSQAINKKQGNFVYAMYQKAIIEGLTGDVSEKILSSEGIIKSCQFEYADDALMQLGRCIF
ncbi:MAG: hypothetical protein IPJ13_15710 [Saprospiraceae bacterium]|nr:hypothetical protein [Saprospiraceae bacterium]